MFLFLLAVPTIDQIFVVSQYLLHTNFENDANRSKIKTTDAQHNFLERSNLINPLSTAPQ